jgi:hypothetical protein
MKEILHRFQGAFQDIRMHLGILTEITYVLGIALFGLLVCIVLAHL